MPHTCLAKSIITHCNPRQIPKNGMLFSLANFEVNILPSAPLDPNPPGIRMPSMSAKIFVASLSFLIFSVLTHTTSTLVLFSTPACINDSIMLLYASCNSVYLPHIAILTL